MPLFYLRPFDFQADKKAHTRVPVVEFDRGDLLLFGVVSLFALALFVVFVIVPMFTVMIER